jgi:hypothetical protein
MQTVTKASMRSRAAGFLSLVMASVVMMWAIGSVSRAHAGTPLRLETLESADLVVSFERPLLDGAKETVRLFPSVRDELTKMLQWNVEFRPHIILVGDRSTFRRMAGSGMVVAFAEPVHQVIVIDYSRMGVHPFDLDLTLKHELCHLLLHSHIHAGLPRWLDEGVSQWVTGGIAEILTDGRRPALRDAALAGRLVPLDDLSGGFPEDRNGLILAYEESRSFVEFIVEQYGTPRLLQILKELKNGRTVNDALYGSIGLTVAEAERRWVSHLNRRITWLLYISNNLYEILFLVAALMTIIASVKIVVRRLTVRKAQEREEEDEGA